MGNDLPHLAYSDQQGFIILHRLDRSNSFFPTRKATEKEIYQWIQIRMKDEFTRFTDEILKHMSKFVDEALKGIKTLGECVKELK